MTNIDDYAILGSIKIFTGNLTKFMESQGPLNSAENSGILDTIMESEQAHALADFNPDHLVTELFHELRERDREILNMRYGLSGKSEHTLDAVGKKLGLTRERVRQIEKEALASLKKQQLSNRNKGVMDIVKKAVEDHGGIMAEYALVDHLLVSEKAGSQINSLVFLLEIFEELTHLPESEHYHQAWHVNSFKFHKLDKFHDEIKVILEKKGSPVTFENLHKDFKSTNVFNENIDFYTDKTVENFLKIIKKVKSNPFGEYGLSHWRVISPKDVGDKSYLVLKHYGKPEHYSKITERINKHKFDSRTAYKETVHNELIMDPRFVLVGRGIYALKEWGYKKGVVSDVIKEVLEEAKDPMDRSQIVEEVMKRRMVKRNTILVGLANKKHFAKVGKNKYDLVKKV